MAQAIALIVGKEKGFVFPDRTAEECAELVSLEREPLRGKVIDRIQFVVANKFVHAAVEVISA